MKGGQGSGGRGMDPRAARRVLDVDPLLPAAQRALGYFFLVLVGCTCGRVPLVDDYEHRAAILAGNNSPNPGLSHCAPRL
jgi:hypothetical protein